MFPAGVGQVVDLPLRKLVLVPMLLLSGPPVPEVKPALCERDDLKGQFDVDVSPMLHASAPVRVR